MTLVFYRSVSYGWRVGLAESLEGSRILIRDGSMDETVSKSDIYIPDKDAELLFHMADNSSIFLQQRDAALMSPSPLVALPPLIELLWHRMTSNEMETDIGDNFTLLIGEGSLFDVNPPGYETALRASLAWRASGQRQVIVSSGHIHPKVCDDLVTTTAGLLGATQEQLRIIAAGLRVLSCFTTTIGHHRLCYAQGHICSDSYGESVTAVRFDCDHLYTSGIGQPNDINFKIFAYMLYGFSGEERERFFINRKQQDFVCQSSLRDASLIARLREEYAALTEAFDTLGIPSSTLLSILTRIAAIVHLTEVEFYEDGSSSNLPALKSAARLLQIDFEKCLAVFTTRGACVATAQLLYDATVAMLVRRVNAAMQFVSGGPPESSVSVLFIQPPPPVESDDLERLVTAIMYEDLAQTFIRASDREIVQWQRAGLSVSPELSAVLDTLDNYSILKVLRGLGGVLSIAQSPDQRPETLRRALASCARHASVRFDSATLCLTVAHSFGTRRYQFPRCSGDAAAAAAADEAQQRFSRTAGHEDYAPVVALLRDASASPDTQECLHAIVQRDGPMPAMAIAHAVQRTRRLLAALQDDAAALWWLHGIELREVRELGKSGEAEESGEQRGERGALESALGPLHVRAALQLRHRIPRRLLSCNAERIARIERRSPAANTDTNTNKNANVNTDTNTNTNADATADTNTPPPPAAPTAPTAPAAGAAGAGTGASANKPQLLDGAALARLYRDALAAESLCACVVQCFARQQSAARGVARRFAAVAGAIAVATAIAEKAVAAHRAQRTAAAALSASTANALVGPPLAALLRDEAQARALLRDEAYGTCKEIEEAMRSAATAEGLSAALCSLRLSSSTAGRPSAQRTRRGSSSLWSPRLSTSSAPEERVMEAFVARRLAAHRARLDGEVAAAQQRSARAQQRAAAAQQRREAAAESANDVRSAAAEAQRRRAEAHARVVKAREAERDARQQRNAARREWERMSRERLSHAREAFADALRAQHAVHDMEARALQRVRDEAAAFRRHQSAVLSARGEEERRAKEAQRQAAERAQWAKEQRSARLQSGEKARGKEKMSARGPKARNAPRAAEELTARNGHRFAQVLRRAETEFAMPRLFEQRADGSVKCRRSAAGTPAGEPFVLASGAKTHRPSLSESSMRGLFAFHAKKARAKSPYPQATSVR